MPYTLCLVESGMPDLQSTVLKRQGSFMRSFTQHKCGEEPLAHALQLCEGDEFVERLSSAENYHGNPEEVSRSNLRAECRTKAHDSTRFATYMRINPSLAVLDVYTTFHAVRDSLRIQLTRLRLSSHRLRVETGRWSRVPREARTCPCNGHSLQNEEHVILSCEKTEGLRSANYSTVDSLFSFFNLSTDRLCYLSNEILRMYD